MDAFQISLRCLRHPLTLLSLVVLLLNDHWLKLATPSPITGKLSDFTGLFFFPFLLAAGLSLVTVRWNFPPHRLATLSFAVTGVWFTTLKMVPTINLGTTRLVNALTGVHRQITMDPSDLIGLLCLLPAGWLWLHIQHQPSHRPPGRLAYLALGVAAIATVATSPAILISYDRVLKVPGGLVLGNSSGLEHQGYEKIEGGLFAFSTDGLAWKDYSDISAELREAGLKDLVLPKQVCRSSHPFECYRITGQSQVERSSDGGHTWTVDWQFPLVRHSYMSHRYLITPPPMNIIPLDIALLELPDGLRVVVAMGDQGALVRLADGSWERVAVLSARPTPLRAETVLQSFSDLLLEEIILAIGLPLMIFVLSVLDWVVVLRSENGRTRRGWALLPLVLWVIGSLLAGFAGRFLGTGSKLMPLILIAGIVGLLMTLIGPLWTWKRVASLAARPGYIYLNMAIIIVAPLLMGLLFLIPLILWTLWVIPAYYVAMLTGLVLAGIILLISFWSTWRVTHLAMAAPINQ
jgi:hypothetical protein